MRIGCILNSISINRRKLCGRKFPAALVNVTLHRIAGIIFLSAIKFETAPVDEKIIRDTFAISAFSVALAVMLFAAYNSKIIKTYRQPLWLTIAGATIVVIMTWMSVQMIMQL